MLSSTLSPNFWKQLSGSAGQLLCKLADPSPQSTNSCAENKQDEPTCAGYFHTCACDAGGPAGPQLKTATFLEPKLRIFPQRPRNRKGNLKKFAIAPPLEGAIIFAIPPTQGISVLEDAAEAQKTIFKIRDSSPLRRGYHFFAIPPTHPGNFRPRGRSRSPKDHFQNSR